jgi:hypothetical protein
MYKNGGAMMIWNSSVDIFQGSHVSRNRALQLSDGEFLTDSVARGGAFMAQLNDFDQGAAAKAIATAWFDIKIRNSTVDGNIASAVTAEGGAFAIAIDTTVVPPLQLQLQLQPQKQKHTQKQKALHKSPPKLKAPQKHALTVESSTVSNNMAIAFHQPRGGVLSMFGEFNAVFSRCFLVSGKIDMILLLRFLSHVWFGREIILPSSRLLPGAGAGAKAGATATATATARAMLMLER